MEMTRTPLEVHGPSPINASLRSCWSSCEAVKSASFLFRQRLWLVLPVSMRATSVSRFSGEATPSLNSRKTLTRSSQTRSVCAAEKLPC